jgi:hypothetical protein
MPYSIDTMQTLLSRKRRELRESVNLISPLFGVSCHVAREEENHRLVRIYWCNSNPRALVLRCT